MHGSLAENQRLLAGLKPELSKLNGASFAVCVPFPYLAQTQVHLANSNIAWGTQNVSEHEKGAYTGEVSASMLTDFGCHFVIIGHSERRTLYKENDNTVALKLKQVLSQGLIPIFCVGESLPEREQGITEQVVSRQLDAVINSLGIKSLKEAVIAYEPVWAIGTGKTATPVQAQEMHAFIRKKLVNLEKTAVDVIILYGGSVKAANANELFSMPDIDGGLIGGASLIADEFIAICKHGAHSASKGQ